MTPYRCVADLEYSYSTPPEHPRRRRLDAARLGVADGDPPDPQALTSLLDQTGLLGPSTPEPSNPEEREFFIDNLLV